MSLSTEGANLRDRFFADLLETARRLQSGPDREVALEALIEAAEQLRDHLRLELAAIRQDST